MKLAPRQLKAILVSMQECSPAIEKRRATRIAVSTTLQFAPLTQDQPPRWMTAVIRDISESGLGLVTSYPLRTGEKLVIRLPAGNQTMMVAATVMHADAVGDGLFLAGLEFTEIIEASGTAPMPCDRGCERPVPQPALRGA